MTVRFVGDVHGRFGDLCDLIAGHGCDFVLLGDVGLGFSRELDCKFPCSVNLHFIRGNHDCPEVCFRTAGYLGDFGYHEGLGLFFVSGAFSIDWYCRREGVSWWRDEELSYAQFQDAVGLFEKVRPEVMVSHDCPESVTQFFYDRGRIRSVTSSALDVMFSSHRPKLWVFGHHHRNVDFEFSGTRFVGLAELCTFDL